MLYRTAMNESLIIGGIVAASVLPLAAYCRREDAEAGSLFWLLLLSAALVFAGWLIYRLQGGWYRGLADTLFVCAAAALVLFTVGTHWMRASWRLAVLLAPYLFLLCMLGLIAESLGSPDAERAETTISRWTFVHILTSVAAYGAITLAAVAAIAVLAQERLLKAKSTSVWSARLPAVADAERAEIVSLCAGQIILGLGILSGMALQFQATGALLQVDHKTLLTLLAFAAVGGLLLARIKLGFRGRAAARYVLLSYLLITLGYPGVKLVTDHLLQ